jgi:hypothetical protein
MTRWPVVEVDEVAALRLFAVVVLPTVLLLMVFVPAVTEMPVREAEMVVSEPFTVREPMVLLAMVTVLTLVELIPVDNAPVPEVVMETDPVPVPLPMMLPVVVPTLTDPFTTAMPPQMPGREVLLKLVSHTKFWMVFPCTLLGVVVPALTPMPTKRLGVAFPLMVQGVPPAPGAVPPIELPLTLKLFPEVLLTEIPMTKKLPGPGPMRLTV